MRLTWRKAFQTKESIAYFPCTVNTYFHRPGIAAKRLQIVFLKDILQIIFGQYVDFLYFRREKLDSYLPKPSFMPIRIRHFLLFFPIDFFLSSYFSSKIYLHNFRNKPALQRVIHIFHEVFNILFSLYFQLFLMHLENYGKSCIPFFPPCQNSFLFYIIFFAP